MIHDSVKIFRAIFISINPSSFGLSYSHATISREQEKRQKVVYAKFNSEAHKAAFRHKAGSLNISLFLFSCPERDGKQQQQHTQKK
jgi:hypothetical protein